MKIITATAACMLSLLPIASSAGVYSDTMGKCLVGAASDEDKIALVRWMFASVTLHPAVSGISALTPEQREQINKTTAEMMDRLLTVSCRNETSEALRFEGPIAMQLSFQIFGQVASTSMMTHPAVGAGFAQLGKHIDEKKIMDLATSK